MTNMSDIARKAGVSTATVSRTFSAPSTISSETRERVIQVAALLDYQPRGSKTLARHGERAVRPLPSQTIGFQFFAAQPHDSLFSNTFYTSILAGAQAEAQRLHLNMLLHSTDRNGLSHQTPQMLSDPSLGGILLVGTPSLNVVEMFASLVPNIVLIDNRDDTGRFEHFVADDFGGGYAATRHLIELGHRRIAFYGPEPSISTFQQRRRGYLCAQFEAGIIPDPRLIFDRPPPSHDALKPMLAADLASVAEERPTAIFAANDFYAMVALSTFQDLGLSVPGDVSIVGFDDVDSSQLSHPPLTTVRVDKEALGRQAVRCLQAWMHMDDAARKEAHSERHEIDVSLVIRGSCRVLHEVTFPK